MPDDKPPFDWDHVHVGQRFANEFDLTPEMVAEYTHGVDDQTEWWRGDSPFGGPVAPPLMLSHLMAKVSANDFAPTSGRVHTSSSTQVVEPVRVGQRIRIEGEITEKYIKRGRRYFRMTCHAFGEAGNELLREERESLFSLQKVEGEGT
ncbi:MAG TPA: MaoC family dehydratase [Dehalococcoidia bacterium]|nr:MaoC family dehydratase [Dehalococcoidia bacterium]